MRRTLLRNTWIRLWSPICRSKLIYIKECYSKLLIFSIWFLNWRWWQNMLSITMWCFWATKLLLSSKAGAATLLPSERLSALVCCTISSPSFLEFTQFRSTGHICTPYLCGSWLLAFCLRASFVFSFWQTWWQPYRECSYLLTRTLFAILFCTQFW